MSANYVFLEKVTVGASVSSVTFNNIPQTGYTDLVVKCSIRGDSSPGGAPNPLAVKFGTTNNSSIFLYGNGSSAASSSTSSSWDSNGGFVGHFNDSGTTANTFSNLELYLPNYTSSNYKSFSVDAVVENNASGHIYSDLTAGLISNTAAISTISFAPSSGYGNFVQYSTFSLYGIAAVGTTPTKAPFAAGGDIIQTDGTYWYHAFLSSGTFTPAKSLSCDVLVVAGGGSGGNGGGGSGQVIGSLANSLASNTAQTVTIGAGGTASGLTGSNGSNSIFGSILTATGGGAGAAPDVNGSNGASSGGGGGSGSANTVGGTASSGGTGGGNNSIHSSPYPSGGGGGFGGNGGNASGSTAGSGGVGVNTVTNGTWLSTALSTTGLGVSGYIAGGGGGGIYSGSGTAGTGGSGGGGNGSTSGSGSAGIANTGSGGGGAYNTGSGGAGGSGVTIIRYLA